MNICVESLQKQTMGVAFFSQNSQLLTFSLPIKEIFSCTRPKSARGKSSSCRFSFSATRNTNYPGQGPNWRFFFSYFVFLPFPGNFEWHCLLEIRIFSFFFLPTMRKSQHATLDWERPPLCHSFMNLTQLIGDIKHMQKIIVMGNRFKPPQFI